MKTKKCIKCSNLFECAKAGECWCAVLPSFMPADNNADCYCRDCLIDLHNEKIETLINSKPVSQILKIASNYYGHELLEKLDYTLEEGRWIFTKWFLLKRGFCCDNGCRNCPYKNY